MKHLSIALALAFAGAIRAQPQEGGLVSPHPEASLTMRILDASGTPIVGAKAQIAFFEDPSYGGAGQHLSEALTGTDGRAAFSLRSPARIVCGGTKIGFYETSKRFEFMKQSRGRWQPWNPTVDLVLREVRKPIPMYAKRIELRLPVKGMPVGFDLLVGDWTAPYGQGTHADLVFTETVDKPVAPKTNYLAGALDHVLRVHFSNPGDGIQVFELPENLRESSFQSPYEAPETGYQSEWTLTRQKRPGQTVPGNIDQNRNYFFRVRTVLGDNGEVKSATYGKIYADFVAFDYYVNPAPNSRNVEFDPERNLFQPLKAGERVYRP